MTAGEVLIERGRLEATRKILTKILGARFGSLPPSDAERIRAADAGQLERWIDRGLTAATLAEVFDGA